MVLRIFQKGFNYSQDGPGNRLVYHLQGCNMRCRWCANPEGIAWEPPLMVTGELEDGCCPHHAVSGGQLDRARCAGCRSRECVNEHRSRFLTCKASDVPVEEILREAVGCRPMYFEGGGVTFTGGEPTQQWEALGFLLRGLQAEHIHTAIETNGTHPHLEELFGVIDHLIMDIKQTDSAIHKAYTGIGNENILDNVRKAAAALPLHLRIPLIHGVNDRPEDQEAFLRFFRTLPMETVTVEILPYHEYGKDKWKQCGMTYTMTDGFVTPQTVRGFEEALRADGVTVIKT